MACRRTDGFGRFSAANTPLEASPDAFESSDPLLFHKYHEMLRNSWKCYEMLRNNMKCYEIFSKAPSGAPSLSILAKTGLRNTARGSTEKLYAGILETKQRTSRLSVQEREKLSPRASYA